EPVSALSLAAAILKRFLLGAAKLVPLQRNAFVLIPAQQRALRGRLPVDMMNRRAVRIGAHGAAGTAGEDAFGVPVGDRADTEGTVVIINDDGIGHQSAPPAVAGIRGQEELRLGADSLAFLRVRTGAAVGAQRRGRETGQRMIVVAAAGTGRKTKAE